MDIGHDERRTWRRYKVPVAGRLFGVMTSAVDCEVMDLSPGGARIQLSGMVPEGSATLYIDRIGRIESEICGQGSGEVRLRFACSEARRQSISEVLGQMLQGGVAQITRLRRQNRIPLSNFYLVRDNGMIVICDAMNISQRGMSLRSKMKLPVGEIATLGQSRVRVVRHHDEGMAVEYIQPGTGAVVAFRGGYDQAGNPRPRS